MSQRYTTRILFSSLIILSLVFAGGVYVGTQYILNPEKVSGIAEGRTYVDEQDIDLDEFWEVWNTLEDRYPFEQPESLDRVYNAISGLASSYDPYTVFFPPKEAADFERDVILGEFTGIGVEIDVIDGNLTVVSPLKDTPADKAGLLPGDVIVSIDGFDARNIRIDQAVERIRGPQGEAVILTIMRNFEVFDTPIVRDVIDIPILASGSINSSTYKIELFSFSAKSAALMKDALTEFNNSSATNLVLDLRGNPGGLLDQAVTIADYFLPAGSVVVQEHTGDLEHTDKLRTQGDVFVKNGTRIVILVDRGSASASEILAGALEEHGVAVTIGTRTFGKGSVQELVSIGDDAALKVTVAEWLTPDGISISENGLEPTIPLDQNTILSTSDVSPDTDLWMETALRYFGGTLDF